MITLYARDNNQYVSFDTLIVMRRCKNIKSPGGDNLEGLWGLFRNGSLYDSHKYRLNLAERNQLQLCDDSKTKSDMTLIDLIWVLHGESDKTNPDQTSNTTRLYHVGDFSDIHKQSQVKRWNSVNRIARMSRKLTN